MMLFIMDMFVRMLLRFVAVLMTIMTMSDLFMLMSM